ncbi:glycosyl hydrolase family 2 [Mucilaginibacter frigoritolerans]|uniref:Glycosyl hydrolase family 2 n=1 Tax=Mucilaginibacter frigoritolerans TaxID=652788 RepID=A0A562U056_9SPHI|nr:glycoside hydrolase family 2 TIM barrel-domain containing protein [Mucilaginibacter frigoritolerans]TWI98764.1 glycosyl hydrolase family 2 [Mucilaginibacter frigoritolerans]
MALILQWICTFINHPNSQLMHHLRNHLSKLSVSLKSVFLLTLLFIGIQKSSAQTVYELNSGWKYAPIKTVGDKGEAISALNYSLKGWYPAVVPGTVLTSQIANKQIPDPFYGMNNKLIPEIYKTGRDYYTYWFVKDFKELPATGSQQVYLNFRGVNYSFDVFLNGHKLNVRSHEGMFLRANYNITSWLAKSGNNRLAVIVYPVDVVGNPNGGQGGDGTIARNVSLQYTAGWDWIKAIGDRNTGIWDKVTIEKTGAVKIIDPHVITLVPGVRQVEGVQQPAIIKVSADLQNATNKTVTGVLKYNLDGVPVAKKVTLKPNATQTVQLADYSLKNPKLWWPNGYGPQNLYNLQLQFVTAGNQLSDKKNIEVGVRELTSEWNAHTRSRQTNVNGQKIFVKGGNWIVSDELLRLSKERYDAEVRFHRDMNLNLIRVWGGGLTERPEFYEACDKYGILVFQDMWGSGDCNGRWVDPMKLEDQATRRKYPDNHPLFLESVKDQVKMLRNYASLAIWCGGNEITPPDDILAAIRDTIMPKLDNTRWFVDFSNSTAMSQDSTGVNSDGPYGIQPLSTFWQHRTYPFNSEVGSVGIGDIESLKRFIPAANLVIPEEENGKNKVKYDSVWEYHTYIGYHYTDNYGKPKDVADFAAKAQLVNYDQYRGLMEGFSSHMWDWYTGVIIWKTQNPWTAMRGQMYDYYLDPNACLYGLHSGSEPVHIMYNAIDGTVSTVNNTFKAKQKITVSIKLFDINGAETSLAKIYKDSIATGSAAVTNIQKAVAEASNSKGVFLSLRLIDPNNKIISDNFYWLPDNTGNYSGLQQMKPAQLSVSAKQITKGKVEVTLSNNKNAPVAFFNRLSLVNPVTKKRILPVFYSDNYVSVLPGEVKKVTIDYNLPVTNAQVAISGWNLPEKWIAIK